MQFTLTYTHPGIILFIPIIAKQNIGTEALIVWLCFKYLIPKKSQSKVKYSFEVMRIWGRWCEVRLRATSSAQHLNQPKDVT